MYPLVVYNSLTRSKVRFIPRDPNMVSWYQCGPTVYAESHLGHARTYVSLDVIRRITRDYLGYNVVVCQNITDIDDKIIIRSSERKVHFSELTAKYEAEFNEDMAMLGVQLPDMVTRVSEYVPEVIKFISTLVERGCAYASNGSVYFDTAAFTAQGGVYGKLMPEQIGNSTLLAEGEGSLTANDDKRNACDFVVWKKTKDHTDDGIVEPSWESPWGPGRPGWHIECSVMSHFALETMGSRAGGLDVHCGGTDLKFPHHENEIAQSEGHSGSRQWVNYFLHTGHLHIKGLKMAKSLKNFITIRQSLEMHTPRQVRFCFLLHKYNAPMDYGDGSLQQAVNIEKIFVEYFHNVKAMLRRCGAAGAGPQYKGAREEALHVALEEGKASVRAALLDDFDTPRAIAHLLELMKEHNKYMEAGSVTSVLVSGVAQYVTKILATLGLVQDSHNTGIGFGSWGGSLIPAAGASAAAGAEGGAGAVPGDASREQTLAPLLDVLTKFRETVRVAAMTGAADSAQTILTAADALRDDVLPELGVRMEDKGSGRDVVTVWKLDDPEVLRREKAAKEEAKARKAEQKAEAARKLREKEEKAKQDPKEMFLSMTDLYAAFDQATGLPTHDKAGEPLSKGVLKKLQKEQSKQADAHEKYKASLAASSGSSSSSTSSGEPDSTSSA